MNSAKCSPLLHALIKILIEEMCITLGCYIVFDRHKIILIPTHFNLLPFIL